MGTCIAAGLVGVGSFAVDASLIEADANRQRSIPGKEWSQKIDPATASRTVRDYLATLDHAAFGAATEVEPKFVSPSDPAAQWTSALKGPAFFAYADNYLIDARCGVIVDVGASRAVGQAEVARRGLCWSGPRRASASGREGWPPTRPTSRCRCSTGWSRTSRSSPTSP